MADEPIYGWRDFQHPPWFLSKDYYAKFGLTDYAEIIHAVSGLAGLLPAITMAVILGFWFPKASHWLLLIPALSMQLYIRPAVIYLYYKKIKSQSSA
ncbi:hypothetical protein [Geothrix mesophila]|uniref:hypothetical protein n=1 Tax=Geothrix mesophila TaxID=2922723 RepID=UPI001FABD14F|nr:hypothetical protein [Geothrix sp. SG198]